MHIVLSILGVLGGLAFWYYRMKYIGGAAREVADAAGKMRGAYNRRKFRKKVEGSPLTAIDDPQTAASVMCIAIMELAAPLTEKSEEILRNELAKTIEVQDPEEMVTFSKWVVDQSSDPYNVARHFSKLWRSTLDDGQAQVFLSMAQRLAAVDGEPTSDQRAVLEKLKERLGLVV